MGMRFLASYLSKSKPPYYFTIYADTLNEAIKTAECYKRKGFICAGVTIKE